MAVKSKTKKKTRKKSTPKKSTAVSIIEEGRLPEHIELPPEIIADPRKASFLRIYFDRESPTYGNMKATAIASGFSEEYAHSITSLKPKWLYDFICQQDFVGLAETHMKEVLMLPNVGQAMGAFGPVFKTEEIKVQKHYKNGKTRMVKRKVKVPVMVPQVSVIKEKTAVAKVVLPAHDPKYGNKGPKVSFNFNFKADQKKYQ
jgi:hypothetical protein